MIPHLSRSRIAKTMTDAAEGAVDFGEAEDRLARVHAVVRVGDHEASTAAGQAAALTAVATAMKCFGRAALVQQSDLPLVRSLPLGETLGAAAASLGATVLREIPEDASHVIVLDWRSSAAGDFVRCCWNGWNAGVMPPWEETPVGDGGNSLAGVFAGALATREVFAAAIGRPRAGQRVSVVSLWEPWNAVEPSRGPAMIALPSALWFIGLGHVGQGFLWALSFIPSHGRLAVLQDDQTVGEENVATGLLTGPNDKNVRKTRVAARWLEAIGWKTSLIERRHYGDIRRTKNDPAIVLTSIDEPRARVDIAGAFDYMIDAGVGHGPIDFETAQIRVLTKEVDPRGLWSAPEKPKDVSALLERPAYRAHATQFDGCGTFALAEASVAVPFVGAAVGALSMAQLLRLGAMEETRQLMQTELSAPEMTVAGAINTPLEKGLGGTDIRLAAEAA